MKFNRSFLISDYSEEKRCLTADSLLWVAFLEMEEEGNIKSGTLLVQPPNLLLPDFLDGGVRVAVVRF